VSLPARYVPGLHMSSCYLLVNATLLTLVSLPARYVPGLHMSSCYLLAIIPDKSGILG
jgi:hypothetical protein